MGNRFGGNGGTFRGLGGINGRATLRAELWLPKRLDAPQQSVAVVKEVTGGKAGN